MPGDSGAVSWIVPLDTPKGSQASTRKCDRAEFGEFFALSRPEIAC